MAKIKIKEIKKDIKVTEINIKDLPSATEDSSSSSDLEGHFFSGSAGGRRIMPEGEIQIRAQDMPEVELPIDQKKNENVREKVYGTETTTEQLARKYGVSTSSGGGGWSAVSEMHSPRAATQRNFSQDVHTAPDLDRRNARDLAGRDATLHGQEQQTEKYEPGRENDEHAKRRRSAFW
ncbi:MAG: hypothetical protein WCK90_04360 [archaeon]